MLKSKIEKIYYIITRDHVGGGGGGGETFFKNLSPCWDKCLNKDTGE